jgi:hypothetical protein
MATSKRTTGALKSELARKASNGIEIMAQSETAWAALMRDPGNEQLSRAYSDLMRQKALVDYEITQLLSWLNPKKGRPEKTLDPRLQAALDERVRGGAHKLSYQQLAIKHSGSMDAEKRKRFAERLKKLIKKLGRTQSNKGK